MQKDNKRPVNLNLMSFKFPPMAIVSIAHRLSGFVLFLLIPFALYLLQQATASPQSFSSLRVFLQSPFVLCVVWVLLAAVIYHVLAGVRHLLMDLGLFEGIKAASATALLLMLLWAVVAILTGVWLW